MLKDDWVFTDVHEGGFRAYHYLFLVKTRAGDILNIIGPFHILANGQKSITLTTLENLLIHHPDTLLTPSLLASAPNCQRKPLVTALVRALSPPTPSLVYGTVLHEVFQSCLQEGRWDAPWIEARVDSALSASFGDLVRASVPLSTAKDEILRRAVGVETFGRRYIGDNPKVLSSTSCSLSAYPHFSSVKLCCPTLGRLVEKRHCWQLARCTTSKKISGLQPTGSGGNLTLPYRPTLTVARDHYPHTQLLSRSRLVVPLRASNIAPKPCCIVF